MRKYAFLTAAISALLLALISTPAHAIVPSDGTYLCTSGDPSISTPNFTITSGVVSSGNSCAGAVVIPAGVTSIGDSAFLGATSLTSITFAAGSDLTSIGSSAFENATGLTSITIPASVTSIGNNAFSGATGLTSITIPASVTSIGFTVFHGTTSLTSITFAAGSVLTSIGLAAFYGATGLTSITIPASVTSIGPTAFNGATALASVYFLGNAPTVGPVAFSYVATGAKAYIKTGATGFGTIGVVWNNLITEIWNESAASSAAPTANAYRADKLATVYFAPLSSKLSKAAKKQLEAAVIANPSAVYKVTGYVQKSIFTRNAKNDSSLSLARAKAIETHLESLGAGVTFTVIVDGAGVPVKNGKSNKARRATLYAMTPVVQ